MIGFGKFITFEGGEGAGKSTQAERLSKRFDEIGQDVLVTREPGGSKRAEEIREILLKGDSEKIGPLAETLLFFAARDDHLEKAIRPALQDGLWVISDRFYDSTRAYQGAAQGVQPEILAALERIVVADTKPDLTIILDLPAEQGLERAKNRNGDNKETDRFEAMDLAFHEALRKAFLEIAEQEKERCIVIDATGSEDEISDQVWEAVVERFNP
ncbi:thymidylate kinase [bacterium MnTg02]|nr:thymidylate kinase [bacterium MnTg02]